MVKIKIKKQSEQFIGGAGDYRQDSEFDPEVLKLGIDKEMHDHGLNAAQADEIAKDELTLDPEDYTKELKKEKPSRKLSEYWKKRARNRAMKAERKWPNARDYSWALLEQERSKKINQAIYELFHKEMSTNEEFEGVVKKLLEKIKKNRKAKMKVQNFGPGTPKKSKKSLSKPYPPHKKGETVSGYYKKAAKKMGGATVSPMGSIGPAEE